MAVLGLSKNWDKARLNARRGVELACELLLACELNQLDACAAVNCGSMVSGLVNYPQPVIGMISEEFK